MKVLIIEDEAPAFRRLQRILDKIDDSVEILDVLDTVNESIQWFEKGNEADLIFMDIQLADGLSFEIFESVKVKSPVIFTTAYDEYAIKAFKVNSIDYLLKPIDEALLKKAIQKYQELKSGYHREYDLNEILKTINPEKEVYKERFLVRKRDRLISIDTENIAYFLTEDGNVYLYENRGEKYIVDKPLELLEEKLDPKTFFRLNRQCISNIRSIENSVAYNKGKILVYLSPKPPKNILVSREKATEFKNWLDF